MEQANQPVGKTPEVSRRTLRLTFKSSAKGLELISVEHLPMITPPQPGERPEAGKHGGQWLELRNGDNGVLAHRLIDQSLFNSVEVHSPDGKIRREFGPPRDITFEVLLPDIDERAVRGADGRADRAAKAGDKPSDATRARSGELRRFDFVAGAEMSASDGYVVGVTKVVDHGPESSRWDLVIVGDGYRASELTNYHTHVQSFIDAAANDAAVQRALLRDQRASNRCRLDRQRRRRPGMRRQPSRSPPIPISMRRSVRCSPGSPLERLLTIDEGLALSVANTYVPLKNQVLCIVNSTKYGGSGGTVATCSVDPQAKKSPSTRSATALSSGR